MTVGHRSIWHGMTLRKHWMTRTRLLFFIARVVDRRLAIYALLVLRILRSVWALRRMFVLQMLKQIGRAATTYDNRFQTQVATRCCLVFIRCCKTKPIPNYGRCGTSGQEPLFLAVCFCRHVCLCMWCYWGFERKRTAGSAVGIALGLGECKNEMHALCAWNINCMGTGLKKIF